MPIPSNYYRVSLNLNSRGNSGTRSVTWGVNYVSSPGAPEIGDPDWYVQGVQFYTGEVWPIVSRVMGSNTELVSLTFNHALGGGSVPVADGPPGARAVNLAPPQMATITRWVTSTPGRRGRGRIFWPDAAENDYGADGVLVEPAVVLYQEMITDLMGIHDDNVLPENAFGQSVNGIHVLHSDGGAPSRVTAGYPSGTPGWIRGRGRA